MTTGTATRETWEDEILARHRWGQHGDKAESECSRLKQVWESIQPVDGATREIVKQIVALEICNWNMEESILALCTAIGSRCPTDLPIGHMRSISYERWRDVWSYYLALKQWLPRQGPSGYSALLRIVDPDAKLHRHVEEMLGERDELKELYVERFCLCLEQFLDGSFGDMSPSRKKHDVAIPAIEDNIRKIDPEAPLLKFMSYGTGGGRLFPCSHKLFRRYDIILSSIGLGKWRGTMPMRGTDGFDRAALVASYLDPIDDWIQNGQEASVEGEIGSKIVSSLGTPDGTKVFLASLLASLLRSQELAARKRAGSRSQKPNQ